MADPEEPGAEAVEQPEVQQEIPADLPLAPDNRPAKNVLEEVNRKYTKIERQQQDMMQMLQQALQNQRPSPAPVQQVPTSGTEYSDEQLGQLAAAGNPEALNILVKRHAQRESAQQVGQFTQAQSVQTGINEFFRHYPMLREDPQHPLTQAVYAMRNRMVASGWAQGPGTDLEAIKNTIAAAPQLAVSAQPNPASDTTRRAGVTAQQSMDGAAPRRSPQTNQTAASKPLDKQVAGIAQRMDVKDPAGSMKRFMDRQTGKRSTVSPTIQQAVREEQA